MENNKGTQEIKMNLHDLNKTVIGALPPLDEKGLKQLKAELKSFVSAEGKYYMLLSNERRDFTIFTFGKDAPQASKFAKEVMEVLEDRGTIKEFDIKDGAIEIWVDDIFYALFPYDLGVVEI